MSGIKFDKIVGGGESEGSSQRRIHCEMTVKVQRSENYRKVAKINYRLRRRFW